jgi:hypothetical protein
LLENLPKNRGQGKEKAEEKILSLSKFNFHDGI